MRPDIWEWECYTRPGADNSYIDFITLLHCTDSYIDFITLLHCTDSALVKQLHVLGKPQYKKKRKSSENVIRASDSLGMRSLGV